MTIEERVSALEARTVANERASERAMTVGEKALERAETVLTKRFEAANEVRAAMQDQARSYVTRGEFQWAIGSVITVVVTLIGLMIQQLLR